MRVNAHVVTLISALAQRSIHLFVVPMARITQMNVLLPSVIIR